MALLPGNLNIKRRYILLENKISLEELKKKYIELFGEIDFYSLNLVFLELYNNYFIISVNKKKLYRLIFVLYLLNVRIKKITKTLKELKHFLNVTKKLL